MKHVKIEIFIPREDSRKLIDKINEAGFLKEENKAKQKIKTLQEIAIH